MFLRLIEDFKVRIGIKPSLKDYGVDHRFFAETIDEMIRQAYDDEFSCKKPRMPFMRKVKTRI